MHLLAATPGGIDDGSEAVDLEQEPGDIVILTAADTEIACFSVAQDRRLKADPDAPSLRRKRSTWNRNRAISSS